MVLNQGYMSAGHMKPQKEENETKGALKKL
jgi:hypothetical protein